MNISSTRGSILFILFLCGVILFSGSMVVAGWNEGKLENTILKPINAALSALGKMTESTSTPEQPTPAIFPLITSEPQIDTPTPTVPLVPTVSKLNFQPVVTPTLVPGSPGTKEWTVDFWKQWEEMSKKNDEMQRQVEETQRQFCLDNPTLCH